MVRILVSFPGKEPATETEFDDSRAEIVIGRDPACDVVIPETYFEVSRRHCSLEKKIGKHCLVVDTANPPYLNGRVIDSGWFVEDGKEIELVRGGPRLRFELAATPRGVPTLRKGKKVPTPREAATAAQTAAASIGTELKSHKRTALLATAGLALAAALAIVYVSVTAKAATQNLVESVPTKEEVAALRQVIADAAANGDDRVTPVLHKAAQSVYMVVRERGTSVGSVGTCWVVDKKRGLLATNAHVAQLLQDLRLPLFVRVLADNDFKNLPVRSVTLHPGFKAFLAEIARSTFENILGKERDCSSLCPACDVALLQVDEPDRRFLGDSIPVADRAVLAALLPGMEVGYVGFPTEGAYDNAHAPETTMHRAHLCAQSDFFHREVPASEAELLQTSIPASGGSSGGPILDAKGRVIGLLSAGNVTFVTNQQGDRVRIASGPGVTFAQRVDLLAELLADSEPPGQKARATAWHDRFDQIRREPTQDEVLQGLKQRALFNLNGIGSKLAHGAVSLLFSEERKVQAGIPELVRFDKVKVAGRIMVTAIADSRLPIRLLVTHDRPDGKPVVYPLNPSRRTSQLFPAVEFDVVEGDSFTLHVDSESPVNAAIDVYSIPRRARG